MAKKKVSHAHQEKPSHRQEDSVKVDREITHSMDSEAAEKLESLKTLNQMLLKEAVERRQQVDSLFQSKGDLESELSRSNSERETLMSEVALLRERAARLELERSVVSVFVAVQVSLKGEEYVRKMKGLETQTIEFRREINEKESEISGLNFKLRENEDALGIERENSKRVCLERNDFEKKLNLQIDECKVLTEKLVEFEEKKRVIEQEIGELRIAYDAVVGEKEGMEMRIKSLTGEKDSVKKCLIESNKLIEQMKEELRGIVREKEVIEEEKNVEMIKRQELENDVSALNEFVAKLQEEEAKLGTIVGVLEKKCVEGEEKQKEMERENGELVEGKKLSEKRNLGLVEEIAAIKNDLNESLKKLAEQKQKIEELDKEKIVMLEAKGRLDSEVGELQNQVDELKADILKSDETKRAYVERIKSLESAVEEYISKLDKITEQFDVESKAMKYCLEEEKHNSLKLKEKIGELENVIGENQKNSGEVKAEKDAIFAEKKELESRSEALKNEIASLQNTIIEGQKELSSMKGKVDLADANSETVLKMLKGTAIFCSKDERDGEAGDFLGDDEEVKDHVKELEMIKNAFKGKVGKVEEMKRELEFLKNSVEDAQKKKSFWTMLSSATTLLAAVSLAYVARAH